MNKLIEVRNLTKCYQSHDYQVRAVEGINFSLKKGDFLSIVGPSGAGKSTLLHSLGGILPPDKGEVLYQNKNIYNQKENKLANWRNKTIGFVFQFYYLIEELNILENIALAGLKMKKKYSFQRAAQLLEYFGLIERKNSYPSQLSGGQKQKVAIARALLNKPSIVLCDEPTGNLDHESQERIKLLLEKINKDDKVTIILVTHNIKLAESGKQMVFIEGGRLTEEGGKNESIS
ncbi:MAG: ABC transporter ATP-binding protein [Candidatus Omnitrophica bacterium]|nr:ABC transporter ATP-binding protein [Candidatus Omnitrophota bacterium]MCF7891572.1 ABC transporter ATP-binding protein [Candidatus Omnitrophota bacterium]MCF7898076.1 ABC transporter ATP-binding protein [Candidatus Omnitrophota bacterium]MCF7909952.1 ABC transporter ATP-binding protein [Candidatus Omnitrophota bacterium]